MVNDTHELGERIAIYRRRRGLSQTVLAGLVGRSESWLSQVERGQRSVDKLSVLIPLAKALRVDISTLIDEPLDFSHPVQPDLAAVDAIRAAISTYTVDESHADDVHDLTALEAVLVEINALQQATQYDRVGSLLPTAIRNADLAVEAANGGEDLRRALEVSARTQQVAAALLSRVGQTDLGWVAADRAITAARRAEDLELVVAGVYRLGQIMLRAGSNEEAMRLAESFLPTLSKQPQERPSLVSLHGALLLIAAIAGARLADRREATRLIAEAERVAERLGEDRNDHWTAFGPSNVRIHATSVAVELGDPVETINQASTVDLAAMPQEMRGRRAQVHLDMAWAYGQQRNDAAAVLSLIEAERLAPDAVRFSPVGRDVIQGCMKRAKRKGAIPGLDALAQRVGVVAP